MFKPLDNLIHSPLRLAIISLLAGQESADFKNIKEVTGATNGNISVQLQKLREAGYVDIRKTFKNNYPNTTCTITKKGLDAFRQYVLSIRSYIDNKEK